MREVGEAWGAVHVINSPHNFAEGKGRVHMILLLTQSYQAKCPKQDLNSGQLDCAKPHPLPLQPGHGGEAAITWNTNTVNPVPDWALPGNIAGHLGYAGP